ncbi:MmcQ/YjbR family DNA-binding protein [Pseudomonas sp. LRF_L74]|uniref:MmcQ/YjbR family DNA-binding protein n=1 Tax=Pseudomonas sp. LRF_L74 TaxID=3369422 RepID=UPI003F6154BE
MNLEQVAQFCLQLPGVVEDIKWGGRRVFCLPGKKMFAIVRDELAFKVDQDLFLGYVDRPGIRPAPYLARAYWIAMAPPLAMSDDELRALLTRAHQLIVGKLPKLQRVGLLLDQ